MLLRLSFERNLCATLSLLALVLKCSKRNEITVGEEGHVRRETAVIGEKLGSGSMHASNDGRRR